MNKKVFIIATCLALLFFTAGSAFAQTATMKIGANVNGAKIYIDGRFVGNAPMSTRVRLGSHTVKVTAGGYEDYEQRVDVRHDVTMVAELRRMQRTFTLSIQANVPQAIVTINGQDQNGFAPMSVRLPQGRYEVKVSKRGFGTFETSVTLNRDERITARLSAPDARIIIIGPQRRGPGGFRFEVSIDGRRMNGTEFRVAPGRHTVSVNAGGLLAEREVNCRPGRTYRFKLDLDLQAPNEADD